MTMEYSPALFFSALLSLLLEWFPGLSTWYNGLNPARKATVNAFGVAVISILTMLYQCRWGTVCPTDIGKAIGEFLLVALLSLAANQGIYQVFRRENYDSRFWRSPQQ